MGIVVNDNPSLGFSCILKKTVHDYHSAIRLPVRIGGGLTPPNRPMKSLSI